MKRYKLMKTTREWRKRTTRENYFQNVRWLEEHIVSLEQINQHVFPWVLSSQTGVKFDALEDYLAQLFSQQDIMHFDEDELLELPQLLSMKKSLPKLISGIHSLTSVLYQMLPDKRMVHLTMLKEPISRVISCYNQKATFQYKNKSKSIADLHFNSLMTKKQRENLNNAQAKSLAGLLVNTKHISDNELYVFAKYALDNCFTMVGVTTYFNEFIQLLRNTTGNNLIDIPTASNNQTKIMLTDITQKKIEQIKNDNQVDLQLYEYAEEKFEKLIKIKKKDTNIVSFFSR